MDGKVQLSEVDVRPFSGLVFRVARLGKERSALQQMRLDEDARREAEDFFRPMSDEEDLAGVLNDPFTSKPSYATPFLPGRFSKGHWPVFYASIKQDTAVSEKGYHCSRELRSRADGFQYHFDIFTCRLEGGLLDLMAKSEWHDELTSDDYGFCQTIGQEASETGKDGFLTPSARHVGAVNTPCFRPSCLSSPHRVGEVVYDLTESGEVRATVA